VFAVGANRAIDLIVAKESGAGGGRRGRTVDPGRALGDHPDSGKPIVVKSGKYGPYVTDGAVNATLPKPMTAEAVTLDEAIGLLRAREASGGGKPKRGAAARGRTAAASKTASKTPKTAAAKRVPGKAAKAGAAKTAKPKAKAGASRVKTRSAAE
jgi:DNA topoisomerase-1